MWGFLSVTHTLFLDFLLCVQFWPWADSTPCVDLKKKFQDTSHQCSPTQRTLYLFATSVTVRPLLPSFYLSAHPATATAIVILQDTKATAVTLKCGASVVPCSLDDDDALTAPISFCSPRWHPPRTPQTVRLCLRLDTHPHTHKPTPPHHPSLRTIRIPVLIP
jgi:hypothetical protein